MKSILVVLTISYTLMSANEGDTVVQNRHEWGIITGANLNVHDAWFRKLGTYPSCCPQFTGGSGWGLYAGAFFTLELDTKWRLLTRLTYSNNNGIMEYNESSYVADLRDSVQIVQAVFYHQLTSTLSDVGIEQLIGFRPFGAIDVLFGPRIALVTSSAFHQTETLSKPAEYGAYLGKGREWVNNTGDIPGASSIRLTIAAGLRYVLPLNKQSTFNIAPELFFNYPLTGVTSDVMWNVSQFHFALAFSYSPAIPDLTEIRLADSAADRGIELPSFPIIVPSINVRFIRFAKNSHDGPAVINNSYDDEVVDLESIIVEDTAVVDQMPLLNHLYFDHGSHNVPERYKTSARKAYNTPDAITSSEATTALLGVVAHNLEKHQAATITITGSTADVEGDMGLELGTKRAEAVRDVLVGLGIDPLRIKVAARRLPASPTRASTQSEEPYAQEENRRVEITSNSPEILRPVTIRSIRRTITPDSIGVILRAASTGKIRSQALTLKSRHNTIPIPLEYKVTSTFNDDTSTTIIDDTTRFPSTLPVELLFDSDSNRIIVDYRINLVNDTASGNRGTVLHSSDTVAILEMSAERKKSHQTADVQIERYILILFAFDDARLTKDHLEILSRIRSQITEGNSVRILGMTDAMGASDYNKELSHRRANEVAKALGLDDYIIEALGEQAPQFNNSLPEGRAYNRTVVIEVISRIR